MNPPRERHAITVRYQPEHKMPHLGERELEAGRWIPSSTFKVSACVACYYPPHNLFSDFKKPHQENKTKEGLLGF